MCTPDLNQSHNFFKVTGQDGCESYYLSVEVPATSETHLYKMHSANVDSTEFLKSTRGSLCPQEAKALITRLISAKE